MCDIPRIRWTLLTLRDSFLRVGVQAQVQGFSGRPRLRAHTRQVQLLDLMEPWRPVHLQVRKGKRPQGGLIPAPASLSF